MEYDIEIGSSVKELAEEVNNRMAEGWRPCGGVAVMPKDDDGGCELLLQALTRDELVVVHSMTVGGLARDNP